MHRQPLLEMLDCYLTAHPGEATMVERISRLVSDHSNCFDRDCRPGHVTASAWVVSADSSRHLLVHHRKLGRWLQPGGHADGDPDVAAVALREVREETGLTRVRIQFAKPLDVDVHPIPERFSAAGDLIDDAHEHHDIRFLCVADANEPLVVSEESHAVRWFSDDELRSLTHEESVLRLLDKANTSRSIDRLPL